LILKAWGRLEEAFELLKNQEALRLELGNGAVWLTATRSEKS
jgi:hypothetical protein